MTQDTKEKIKEKAKLEGLDPSSWMRQIAKKNLPHEATTA